VGHQAYGPAVGAELVVADLEPRRALQIQPGAATGKAIADERTVGDLLEQESVGRTALGLEEGVLDHRDALAVHHRDPGTVASEGVALVAAGVGEHKVQAVATVLLTQV